MSKRNASMKFSRHRGNNPPVGGEFFLIFGEQGASIPSDEKLRDGPLIG